MKTKWILSLLFVALLPLSGSALLITTTYNNSTSDNDNHVNEDSAFSQIRIGSSSATVDSVGNSSGNMGYRFTGQASAYGYGELTQTINVTAIWTVTAEDWEIYSVTLTPELHAYLNIYDWSTDESDDDADFNSLSSVLKVNGSVVSDSLNGLTGYAKSTDTDNGTNLDKIDSQVLTGYSGNNTFSLQLTGTVYVDAHGDTGWNDNPTGNAVLWGQDGTMDFDQNSNQNNFDEYSSSSTASSGSDGIFVDANITLDAVPEPASLAMILVCGGILGFLRRRLCC